MNKKFNLLALAAAASACGALVLTSCGGSGKTHIVLFKTDGLRDVTDSTKPIPVSLKVQRVKDGKNAKAPINVDDAEAQNYARYTWRNKTGGGLECKALELYGWSESTEDETTGSMKYREFSFKTPITGDTVLYPLYSDNKVHCLTVILVQSASYKGTWNDATCNSKHVWAENWFETGANLKTFKAELEACVQAPSGSEIEGWTYIDKDSEEQEAFDWDTATITEDITITAKYTSSN